MYCLRQKQDFSKILFPTFSGKQVLSFGSLNTKTEVEEYKICISRLMQLCDKQHDEDAKYQMCGSKENTDFSLTI